MRPSPESRVMLEVEGLVLASPLRDVVRGVSFAVREKSTTCLVGESGSGKTMICLALMGVLPQGIRMVEGKAFFANRDLFSLPPRQRRNLLGKSLGMVFQDPLATLNPVVRAGDHLEELLKVHLGLSGKKAAMETLALLEMVGLASVHARAYPDEISGGERQRLGIALAIAARPRLLIADEPTTSLDVLVQAEILTLLRHLQKEEGMAMLFVTHDFGVVAEMAHEVVVLQDGLVVEAGESNQVLSSPVHPYTKKLLSSLPGRRLLEWVI